MFTRLLPPHLRALPALAGLALAMFPASRTAAQCVPQGGVTVCTGGQIIASGPDAVGLSAEAIETDGTEIIVDGTRAVGLLASDVARLGGAFSVRGSEARGIVGGGVFNAGSGMSPIRVQGFRAAAIEAPDHLRNGSGILATGTEVRGIIAGELHNSAPLDVRGFLAIAIHLRQAPGLREFYRSRNTGTIRVEGGGAIGVLIEATGPSTGVAVPFVNGPVFSLPGSGSIDASASADGVGLAIGPNVNAINFGTIRGGTGSGAAVSFLDAPGSEGSRDLTNHGLLEAVSGVAVRDTGTGNDRLWNNSGHIRGDVLMGAGDDAVFFREDATIDGILDGGEGEDDLRLRARLVRYANVFDMSVVRDFERLTAIPPGSWTLTGSASIPEVRLGGWPGRMDSGARLEGSLGVVQGVVSIGDGASISGGLTVQERTVLLPDRGARISSDIAVETSTGTAGVVELRQRCSLEGTLDLEGVLQNFVAARGSVARLDVTGELMLGAASELRLVKVDSQPFDTETTYMRVVAASGGITGEFASVRVLERDCSARCVDVEMPGVTATATYREDGNGASIDVVVGAP